MKLTLSTCFLIFAITTINGQKGFSTGTRVGCLPGCSCGPQANNKGTQYRVLRCNTIPEQPLPSQYTTFQATKCPSNISRTDLSKLNPTSITTLDLCNSGIHNVADGTFSVVPQLTTLKLSFNSINKLAVGYFLGCDKLQKIYLDSNELTTIDNGCFSQLPKLKILHLHHNKLMRLPPLPPNVIQLDISNNAISSLDNYVFQQNMKNLDLCENPIKEIPKACFASAQAMTSLCAPNIPIVWKSTVPETPTTILPSLENFTMIAPMPGIELSEDVMQQIKVMENLRFLTIVGYKISLPAFLGEQILEKLKLENVRLIGNKEKEFLNAIYKQTTLHELDLNSSPQLASILIQDVTIWNTLIKLHYLGLGNCSLTTLGHLQNEKGMVLVDLTSNPLHCDCKLANKFNNSVMIVGDLSLTLCSTPIKYQNQPLSKVLPQLCDDEEELQKSNEDPSRNNAIKEQIPGSSTGVRDTFPDDNKNEESPVEKENPNDKPVDVGPNENDGSGNDKEVPNGSPDDHNNPDGNDEEVPNGSPDDNNNPNGNNEDVPNGSPDDHNNHNGNEESETIDTSEEPTNEHTSQNENHEVESTAHSEHVTESTESQGFQGYIDEKEHEVKDMTQTYIIVGIVVLLALIAAIIFTTLFFYFRRRGHAGIEGANAQYRSNASSRDTLVKKTRGYD